MKASRGVASEEREVAEEKSALKGGSVTACRGMAPTGQVHDRVRSDVTVQTVATVKDSEAGGGRTVVIEETAQARPSTEAAEEAGDEAREGGAIQVAPEEEEAEEEAVL